jgi:hypothetical protein
VTRYQPLWEQAGQYAASQDRSLLGAIWPAGGVTGGAVTASATAMTVTAAPGTAVVPLQAGQGCALCRWDAVADSTMTLNAAPPAGQSRIDVYSVQVRDNALDGLGNNDFVFAVTTGLPATSNPAVPATPNNAYALANITVPGGVANLSTATVTRVSALLAPSGAVPAGRLSNTAPLLMTATMALVPMGADGSPLRGGMTVASNALVVPQPGWYQINASGFFNASGGGQLGATGWINVGIYRNGAEIRGSNYYVFTAGVCTPTVPLSDIAYLSAGDQVALYANANMGNCYCSTGPSTLLSAFWVAP